MSVRRLSFDTVGVLFFDMVNYGAKNAERAAGEQLKQWKQGLANSVRIYQRPDRAV